MAYKGGLLTMLMGGRGFNEIQLGDGFSVIGGRFFFSQPALDFFTGHFGVAGKLPKSNARMPMFYQEPQVTYFTFLVLTWFPLL